ncbi:MAG: transcriptional regulator [Methanosarcinales archaeon]|jgi:hypothetical protein|nr:transcriptional regulator [Methanosarcinales archaeon]
MAFSLILDIVLILAAILIAYLLYKILKTAKKLAVNIIVGFIILAIAWSLDWFVFPTEVFSILAALIVTALTGVFGALLLIILSLFGLFPF